MFALICSIITAISASLLLQVIVGTVIAACMVWWDEFGKDFLAALGAVICIVGIIYVGLAVSFASLGWSVAVEDIIVIVIAGIIGIEKLADWVTSAVKWVAQAAMEILKVVDKAFPWVKWVIGGVLLYKVLSPSSNSGSVSYYPAAGGDDDQRDHSDQSQIEVVSV